MFPDREWARGANPVLRQAGNRSLALWGGDALPVIPTWEDHSEMGAALLHDEPTFDVLGRLIPVYTESYVQCLSVSHLLWWDHWRIFFNVRKGLRRLVRLEGSVGTLPAGSTLGWGGPQRHRQWSPLAGVSGVRGARNAAHIAMPGPHAPGPGQGRPGTFDYIDDTDLMKDRSLPHRVGRAREYGGRRGGQRLGRKE